MMQKVCPVLVREADGHTQILAFRHPLAGSQIVKGTVEAGESLEEAAVREMLEESGGAVSIGRFLGSLHYEHLEQEWHVFLCRSENLPTTWTHWTSDGGGHMFTFYWHVLSERLNDDWHPDFARALGFIADRLAAYRIQPEDTWDDANRSKVELVPHRNLWAKAAAEESRRLRHWLGPNLLVTHHIGSTSIPEIRAKPIIDMMPVVANLSTLDDQRHLFEQLGYGWRGEYGLPGRRYCFKNDPVYGHRLFQVHCYEQGSMEIDRHLAFRDYLRAHPVIAKAYEEEKWRCRVLHPADSHIYGDCKRAWIDRTEADALTWKRF